MTKQTSSEANVYRFSKSTVKVFNVVYGYEYALITVRNYEIA